MIALLAALLAVVSSPVLSVSYLCDAVTAQYVVTFPYQAYTDIVVISTTAGGAVTTLVYTTDFTVNLSSNSGTNATLTLNSPSTKCPVGSTLKISRVMALNQLTSFKTQLNFNPSLHETAYDRLTMQLQQVNANIGTGGTVTTAQPITGNGTPVSPINCQAASGSQAGCLSSTDWTTFNNKASGSVSLSTPNTWSAQQSFVPGAGNTSAILALGLGTGAGVLATGGGTAGTGGNFTGGGSNGTAVFGQGNGTATGLWGIGGGTSGKGVLGAGGTPNGLGVQGTGTGTGVGVFGQGGLTSAAGVSGNGGTPNGPGVIGTGIGSGAGVTGTGGFTGAGTGVVGIGQNTGVGGSFTGSGIGVVALGGTNSAGISTQGGPGAPGVGLISVGGSSSASGTTSTGGTPNGKGLVALGLGSASGIESTGGDTSGDGIRGTGGIGSGDGGRFVGGAPGSGTGVEGTGGGTDGSGVVGNGTGSGAGGVFAGGASGNGIRVYAGVNLGIYASSSTNGVAILATGNSARFPYAMTTLGSNPTSLNDGDFGIVGSGSAQRFDVVLNGALALVGGNPYLFASSIAGQSIPNGALTTVIYGTTGTDTDSGYNSGTGIYTVPANKGGVYAVTCSVAWNVGFTATIVEIDILQNSAAVALFRLSSNPVASATVMAHTEYKFAASDTIKCQIFQNQGGAEALNTVTAANYISIKRLSD